MVDAMPGLSWKGQVRTLLPCVLPLSMPTGEGLCCLPFPGLSSLPPDCQRLVLLSLPLGSWTVSLFCSFGPVMTPLGGAGGM